MEAQAVILLRLAVVILGLTPAVAMADATTIAALIAYVGGSSYVVAAVAIIGAIYQSSQARRKARAEQARLKSEAISNMVDKTQTVYSASPAHQYAYGSATLAGTLVAIFHSDSTGIREDSTTFTRPDGLIHYVIEWTHRQASAIREVFIDGVAVGPTDGSGYVTSGDFFSTRSETRSVIVPGSSFADVPDPVVTVLSCFYYNSIDGTNNDVTPTLSIGNTRITNPNINAVHVDYTVQANRAAVRVNHHLGDPGQTVDTYLSSVRPVEWDSTHRGRGRCYSVFTLNQEDQRFQGGNIPLFQADGDWALVLDPRTGTTAWSDNPALCIRDWLISQVGYSCVSDDIDDTYTIASANACDAVVTIDDGSGPYLAKKYTCNGAFTSDMGKEAVLSDLEESMCGHASYGAQWMVQAGYWTTPVQLPGGGGLDDDDLDGQISIVQADTPSAELFNSIRGNYYPKTIAVGTGTGYLLNGSHAANATSIAINTGSGTVLAGNGLRIAEDDNTYIVTAGVSAPGTVTIQSPGLSKAASAGAGVTIISAPKTAQIDIRPPYQNSTFVASDGGEEWGDELSLPFTNTGGRARNIARIKTEQNRSGLIINFPAKLRAITLRVGERIEVTNAEHGFSRKVFRLTDRRFGLQSAVMLTLQEDDPSIYDEADAATADPTPNTRLPNPYSVQAIQGLAATSDDTTALKSNLGIIAPRVSVTWTAVTDRYVIEKGRIRIRWRYGAQPWVTQEESGDATGTYIVGPQHDDRLVIEVTVINGLGKEGPPTQIAHTVDGPTLIGTDQAESQAWTEPLSDNSASGSVSDAGASGHETKATVATKSWTNNTGATVTVQFEGRVTVASTGTGFAYPTMTTAGSPSGVGQIAVDGSTFPGQSRTYSWMTQYDIPDGDTAISKLELTAQSGGGAGQSAGWSWAWVRVTAIKR